MNVLVGGVGQLYQGDLDVGRLAVERLAGEDLGPGVLVEELHYGAVAVAQRLEELRPSALVLVGATQRQRAPGSVRRRRIEPAVLDPGEVHRAVGDAVTGYVNLDLVIEVATGLGVLPTRTVSIEVEPEDTGPSELLSRAAQDGLDEAVELVRREVRRVPLLELADELAALTKDGRLEPSPALESLRELLGALTDLDREGRWGAAFAARDHLRQHIAGGATSEGMSHLDWGLWWALIEELDRLQGLEASGAR